MCMPPPMRRLRRRAIVGWSVAAWLTSDPPSEGGAAPPLRGRRRVSVLLRRVPGFEPGLDGLGGLLGRHAAVHDVGRGGPEVVPGVRLAARQDLVGDADRALALAAPGD